MGDHQEEDEEGGGRLLYPKSNRFNIDKERMRTYSPSHKIFEYNSKTTYPYKIKKEYFLKRWPYYAFLKHFPRLKRADMLNLINS